MTEKAPKYVIIIRARGYCKYQDYLNLFEILSRANKKPKRTRKKGEIKK